MSWANRPELSLQDLAIFKLWFLFYCSSFLFLFLMVFKYLDVFNLLKTYFEIIYFVSELPCFFFQRRLKIHFDVIPPEILSISSFIHIFLSKQFFNNLCICFLTLLHKRIIILSLFV